MNAAAPGPEVSAGQERDLVAIGELERTAFGSDAWSDVLVAEGLQGRLPTVSWWVVRDGRSLLGYAVLSVAGDLAELQRIAVDPRRRRLGLGRALVEALVARAGQEGAEAVLLEVRPDNAAALSCYAAAGFVTIDRRRRYYRDGADAIVMRRPLADEPTSAGVSGVSGD